MPSIGYSNKVNVSGNHGSGEILLRFFQDAPVLDPSSCQVAGTESNEIASVILSAQTAKQLIDVINQVLNSEPELVENLK